MKPAARPERASDKAPPAVEARPVPAPKPPDRLQAWWLTQAKDQPVVVRLLDGKALSGKLLSYDTYSFTLEVPGLGGPVLIFKHGVQLVRRAGPAEAEGAS